MTEKLNSSNLRQNPRNVNELVNELTLFDDDLMSRVFDKNIKATELLLRIILGKKVKVISATGSRMNLRMVFMLKSPFWGEA